MFPGPCGLSSFRHFFHVTYLFGFIIYSCNEELLKFNSDVKIVNSLSEFIYLFWFFFLVMPINSMTVIIEKESLTFKWLYVGRNFIHDENISN